MPGDLLPPVDPHPALVAVTVPTSRDMMTAIAILGLFREDRWEPVVRA